MGFVGGRVRVLDRGGGHSGRSSRVSIFIVVR